jgi:hypothetical protein
MSMSKKDYVAIAAILLSSQADRRTREVFAVKLADIFGMGNPRFDRARFLKACGVQS